MRVYNGLQKLKELTWVAYLLVGLYVTLTQYLIWEEKYYLLALPLVLLIAYYVIFSVKHLFLLLVFFTPLSLTLKTFIPYVENNMSLPTEPILMGLMLLFIIQFAKTLKYDARVLLHPLTIAILLNISWIIITSITSTMPAVSIKFFISRLWFVIGFYFLAIAFFYNKSLTRYFIWLYTAGFVIVIAYALTRLSKYGLSNKNAAHSVMSPFFSDHTSYGAMLAMLIPVFTGFCFNKNISALKRTLFIIATVILFLAVIFSYTRAAWISLLAALGVYVLIRLKIKFRTVVLTLLIFTWIGYTFNTEITRILKSNNQDSSTDFAEHIQSITNISSDASNMERINRWKCAIQMFKEKPVLGWGPGTYMFQYAPYQLKRDVTIISTRIGDWGNAHSEYLGSLSESGLPGMLTFVLIEIIFIISGLRVYRKCNDYNDRIFIVTLVLGSITYFIHGFLNNFLDTDKASALFWGYMAIIISYELYHNKTVTVKRDSRKL